MLGGVLGGFRVVGGTTIKDFHLSFTETGESAGCAGGEGFESKPEGKSATLKFAPGATAPIVKTTAGYLVSVANSGGTAQAAEVPITVSVGSSREGSLRSRWCRARRKLAAARSSGPKGPAASRSSSSPADPFTQPGTGSEVWTNGSA